MEFEVGKVYKCISTSIIDEFKSDRCLPRNCIRFMCGDIILVLKQEDITCYKILFNDMHGYISYLCRLSFVEI